MKWSKTSWVGASTHSRKFVGVKNEIGIYKNLKLTVAGGYLFAGKAMDQYTGTTILGIPLNNDIKNPWVITWNLTYRF